MLTAERDETWQTLRSRLEGLTDEASFWEPVPHCWTASGDVGDRRVVDYAAPMPESPPCATVVGHPVHPRASIT